MQQRWDVTVETQFGLFKHITVYEPVYLPLQYPLLFPKGEDGYRDDIQFNESTCRDSIKRQKVTQRVVCL